MHQSLDSPLVPTLWVEDLSVLEMFHPNSPFDDEEFDKPFSRQNSLGQDVFDENSLDAPSYSERLNLEYELWAEEQFLPGVKLDPTLAELNDDQRSRSPLINPEMQSLYNAATRTVGETSNETARPTALRPPEQPTALPSEDREVKTREQSLPVKTIKKEPLDCMDNSCSDTTSFVKKEEDNSYKSAHNWSSTVVRPTPLRREENSKLAFEETSLQNVDNSQAKFKLSKQGKLDSKPLQLPQLISAKQHSQIYSLNEQGGTLADRSKAEDQVAEFENTATSPLNVDNSDSDGEMDIDSDEDYDEENLSPIDPLSSSKPRKGRRGECDDLNPNPRRLLQIGRELDKLNKTISDLKPIHQLPMSAKNKSRKEKNKLASRACRLKKKAQHEANKVKLCGLNAEEQRLTQLIDCMKKELLMREQNRHRTYSSLSGKLEDLASSLLKGPSIAGHTPEFIDAVIKATARGNPTGGLNNIFDINK